MADTRTSPSNGRHPAGVVRPGLAGAVSAGVALAVTELVGSLAGEGHTTVVTAVGSRFIERFAASLKEFAVRVFGRHDKAALVAGIVVVCLLVGVVAGIAEARRRWVGAGVIAAIGVVGLLASLADPLAPAGLSTVAVILAVGAGVASLRLLLTRSGAVDRPVAASATVVGDPTKKLAGRRSFLGAAATLGTGAAAATVVARSLRSARGGGTSIESVQLPAAAAPAVLPDGTIQLEGLTPYIVPNDAFYRIDTALVVPRPNVDSWTLRVDGMVDHPFELTYAELSAMDLVEETITIACVSNGIGGDLVGNAVWRGVPLTTLLDRAGVQSGATQVFGHSVDEFTAGFPTEKARDGRTALVAIGMNGEALPARHGFPARLIVAGLYGYVSAVKWLSRIELTTLDAADGFWIPRGWSKDGPVKTQSRIDVPKDNARLSVGRQPIAGVAWAPTRGITRVEVRIDEGPWQTATLGETSSDETWAQWLLEWDATAGRHEIEVRATDSTGEPQTAERTDVAPNGATGHHMRSVRVG